METKSVRPAFFAIYYEGLKEIAIKHGYALALHGTLQRDMDLIAAPWIANPNDPKLMLQQMTDYLGGFMRDVDEPWPGQKPHGRKAYVIYVSKEAFLDISVMPTIN